MTWEPTAAKFVIGEKGQGKCRQDTNKMVLVIIQSWCVRCVALLKFVLFDRCWGIVTVPEFHHERIKWNAPTSFFLAKI